MMGRHGGGACVQLLLVVALLLCAGAHCGVDGLHHQPSWSKSKCPDGPEAPGEIQDGKECAEIAVPLLGTNGDADWLAVNDGTLAAGANGTITLFVRRYRPEARGAGESKGQLWLIPGGPGQAGSEMAAFTPLLAEMPYTIVIADHRGTGRSAYLGCPEAEDAASAGGTRITIAEWPGCIQLLEEQWTREGLQGFSTTNAARDLRYVASLIKEEEQGQAATASDYRVTLFGSSYGTLVASRAVLIEEEEANATASDASTGSEHGSGSSHHMGRVVDAIALDGTVYPKGYGLLKQVGFFTASVRVTLDACADDDACRAYLGREPYNMLDTLIDRLRAGHCREVGMDPEEYRLVLGMLNSLQPGGRPHILVTASIVRLLRCNSEDVVAMKRFQTFAHEVVGAVQASLTEGPAFSQATLMVVSAQEVVEDLPPGNDNFWSNEDVHLEQSLAALFAHPRVISYPLGLVRLPRDQYANRMPSSLHVPVLLLSGALDANTPHLFSRLTYLDYLAAARPNTVPPPKMLIASTSGHGVLTQDERALSCMQQWLDDPATFDAAACMPFVALDFLAPSDNDQSILGDAPFGDAAPETGPAGLLPRTGASDAIAHAVQDGTLASAEAVGGSSETPKAVVVFVVLNFVVLVVLCVLVVVLARRTSPRSASTSSYSLQENLLSQQDP